MAKGSDAASTTKLWTLNVEVTFEAPDAEAAGLEAETITAAVMGLWKVWSANGHFEPEQTTETVDV